MMRLVFILFGSLFFAQATLGQDVAEKYYMKGVEFQEKGIYSRAVDYYTTALQKNPNHSDARYNRAVTFFEIKKYHKALFDIRTLLETQPEDADLYSLTGLIYAKLQKPTKAIYYIDRAIELGDAPIFHLRKADILLQTNQPELAFNELSTASDDPELEVSALELMATAYLDLNQPNQALRSYSRLIQLSPNPEYYYNRGLIHQQLQFTQEACDDFAEASKQSFFAEAIDALIRCQWKQGDIDAVERTGKNGIIHFPNNPTFYFFSGLAALKKGKSPEALKWFEKAEHLGLHNIDLHINKGLALLYSDKVKAQAAFELALKIDPNNTIAKHNLEVLKQ